MDKPFSCVAQAGLLQHSVLQVATQHLPVLRGSLPLTAKLARSLTQTFARIRPQDVAAFVFAQIAGGVVGMAVPQ